MIVKRTAIITLAVAGLVCFGCGASAGPAAKSQTVSATRQASAGPNTALILVEDWKRHDRRHYRHRLAKSRDDRYYGYGSGRTSAGPPYDSCYMKCIQSMHPADFCQEVSHQHFCY